MCVVSVYVYRWTLVSMATAHLCVCVCLYPQKESEEAVQIQNVEAIRVISSLLQVKILSAITYITNRE